MSELLKYIGSLFTGGIIFLMLITFFSGVSETAVTQTFSTVVQENMVTSTELIERDIRLIGYGVSDSDKVLLADSTRLVYRVDLNDITHVDTVMFELGPVLGLAGGNPNARILYRSVNAAAPEPVATGVTDLRFLYYDSTGTSTTTPRSIRAIAVGLTMESDSRIAGAYPGVVWERTIKPKNLR